MAWAEVQTANFANADSGSLGSNVASGNSVILHVTSFSTSNVTISSSAPTFAGSTSGFTATQLWSVQSGFTGGFTVYASAWLLAGVPGSSAAVGITVTNGTLNTAVGLQATEFSGGGSSPSIDNTNAPDPATNNSNAGTSITSGSTGTTTSAADLIFGGGCDGNGGVSSGGTGFTNTAVMGSATVCGWQIPGSTGTFAYAFTGATAGDSVAGVVALKTSAAGTTVNLTTAALTLAAPAGSLAITSTVSLNTPNLALGAPAGAPGAANGAPSVHFDGNLLSPDDCDFEGGLSANWAPLTNCSLAQSNAQSFTGSHSMAVTATANGNVQALVGNTAKFQALATTSLIASCWVRTTVTRTASLSMWFYTAGSGFISFPSGPTVTCPAGVWTPLQGSFAAPATSALGQVVVTVNGLSASEVVYVDTVFAAPCLFQILAALASTPLSTSPVFADLTPFTRADRPITWTRGRGDENTTVQPGTANFTLDNMVVPGAFAQGNTSSPFAGWQTGKVVQVNEGDETGAWHTRFTGFVTDIVTSWEGGTGGASVVAVTCQDILGWLGRGNNLRTMIEEECLLDSPMCLYTLADGSGSHVAADSSGNAVAPLRYVPTGSGASMTFSSGTGVIGSGAQGFVSSALSCPTWVGAVNSAAVLQGYLPQTVSAATGFTAEIWFRGSTNGSGVFTFVNSRTREAISVATNAASGSNVIIAHYTAAGLSSTISGNLAAGGRGQLVLTVSGTNATLNTLGGALNVGLTIPAAFTADFVVVGGVSPSFGGLSWNGQLSVFSVYNSVLSGARMLAHYNAGWNEYQGSWLATVAARILTYAGIPAALQSLPSPGVSYLDAYEINGQTPLSVLQLYQQVDGGVFYVSSAGVVTFQDRAARYAAQVTPAIVLATGQYEPDLQYTTTTQYQVNDATFANNNIPGGVRAINAPSVAASGTFSDGDPQSPQTGPWYSYPWQTPPAGVIANPDVLTDAAQYQVNIYGTPGPRAPNLTIDLMTQAAGGGSLVSRATVLGIDVGACIQVNGLPSTGPGGTRVNFLMVEGITETFQRSHDGSSAWTVAYNTSPATASAAWIAADANLGVLDLTAVTGRGTDGAQQLGTEYVGPPYPVPSFSSGMNRTGNVGANDLRGLTANVALSVRPPVALAQQVSLAQSVSNNSATAVLWDFLYHDTVNGFMLNSSASAYTVQIPGVYKVMGIVAFVANATGDRWAWFNKNGSQITGQTLLPAGGGVVANGLFTCTEVTCNAGDTLQLMCQQTSGGALALTTSVGGCMMSVVWLGN